MGDRRADLFIVGGIFGGQDPGRQPRQRHHPDLHPPHRGRHRLCRHGHPDRGCQPGAFLNCRTAGFGRGARGQVRGRASGRQRRHGRSGQHPGQRGRGCHVHRGVFPLHPRAGGGSLPAGTGDHRHRYQADLRQKEETAPGRRRVNL